jgi:hypothetical protein
VYYNRNSIISNVIGDIISNPKEEAYSGNEWDAITSPGDTNSDSSGSELSYSLNT